jgi:hypothetical protein
MVMLVPIAQGGYSMIDDEDIGIVGHWRWRLFAHKYPGRGIRVGGRKDGKQGVIYLHRAIMNAGEGEQVDHINGDPRDNRRVNLRIVNHRQNVWNSSGDANSKSRFKGVSEAQGGRWVATIRADGKRWSLGVYDDELLAAAAYNGAAIVLHGQYARLNPITHGATVKGIISTPALEPSDDNITSR